MSTGHVRIRICIGLLSAGLALAACTNPQERVDAYARDAARSFAEKDYAKARIQAQNALQLAPKNVPARYLLAQIAEENSEFGQMLGHLEVIINEDPKHVPSRLKLAKLLIFSRDYESAQVLVDQLAVLAPDDLDYLVLVARLQFQKGQIAEGIATLDTVVSRDPANTEAALLRGLALSYSDPQRALADLADAAARVDTFKALSLRQARIDILQRQGDDAAMEGELRQLIKDYPGGGFARDLINVLVAKGRIDEAEAALRDAVAQQPKDVDLKLLLAQFLANARKNPRQAEETLRNFAAESPDEPRLPLVLGTFYEAMGRPQEAIVQYQAVAQRAPGSTAAFEARARIATIKAEAGQRGEARSDYDAVLADAPDNPQALAGRALLNLAESRFDDAIADARGVLRKEPENVSALLTLARAHSGRGEPVLAQDAYRTLLQVEPRAVDAATELGVLLQASGQLAEAEALFRDAVKQQPNYVPAGSGLVEALIALGRFDDAEVEARRLAALNDSRGIGQIQLGKVLQAKGDMAAATRAFRAALERDPRAVVALQGVVGSLTITGDLNGAGREIQSYLARSPDSLDGNLLLAGNLIRRGQLADARAVADKAIAIAPKDARGYILAASTLPDDPAGREKVLRQGIAASPASASLVELLAGSLVQAGRIDDAVAVYEAALTRDASQAGLANSYAALLLDVRNDAASHKRALELVQPYADGRNAAGLDTLGWAHYRLKDPARAVAFLERALAIETGNPVIHYHLGMAYVDSGNAAGAAQHLRQALTNADGTNSPVAALAEEALARLGRSSTPAPARGSST